MFVTRSEMKRRRLPSRGVPGIDIGRVDQIPHSLHLSALTRLEEISVRIRRTDPQRVRRTAKGRRGRQGQDPLSARRRRRTRRRRRRRRHLQSFQFHHKNTIRFSLVFLFYFVSFFLY